MKINQFFTEVLGARVYNPRWSWGAVDSMTNRVFLRVWKDTIDVENGEERIQIGRDTPRRKSNGFAERQRHIAQIENGASAFGVLCTAVDPNTAGAREIESFEKETLLQLGEPYYENGNTYARILSRVAVHELARQRTAQSTLVEDLKPLFSKRIDLTTRDALVSARIGQGTFRSRVLDLWNNRCSVTGATTVDVIRASHIKPWRSSTNAERLDPYNGLPLVASLDALFDAGLISFGESGNLIISSLLNGEERQILALNSRSLTICPPVSTGEYLTYHRERVFRK